jgi:hypothetical protein
MRIVSSFLCGFFILLVQNSFAQDAPIEAQPSSFLGLKNDSFNYSKQSILELWAYQNGYGNDDLSDMYKLRFYQPLSIHQWKGMMRIDTAISSTWGPNAPGQSSGQFSAGNTMLTIWGMPPAFLPNLNLNLGGRIIFPFGNNGQWAVGPQLSATFAPQSPSKSLLSDFSPLVRYMYGFDSKNNSFAANPSQPPLLRTLQLFPTVGLQLTPATQIRFWDENGMLYNTAGGGWFVPLDAMVTHSISKHLLFAIGASKEVVQTFQAYDWSIYGKISIRF